VFFPLFAPLCPGTSTLLLLLLCCMLLLFYGALCYRRVTGSADSGCVFIFSIGVCLMVLWAPCEGEFVWFDLNLPFPSMRF
jgi:hypothetical protein